MLQIQVCSKTLGLKDIQVFKLVPIEQEWEATNTEIAIRVHNSSMSVSEVEKIIKERDHYKELLQKANEGLCAYLKELQKMNKYLFDIVYANSSEQGIVQYIPNR